MNRHLMIGLAVLALMAVTGCGAIGGTGQSSSDAAAVQQYFPTIPGYNATTVDNIIDAITTVTGGASLATGNPLGAAAIARLNTLIDCYRDVGALDARVYTQITIPPVLGALAIVNQDRAAENFASCAVGAGAQSGPRSSDPQPCIGTGSFVQNDDTYLYVYASSDQALCNTFVAHFTQYQ
ncbi:MAG: hypothetical protein H7Y11_04005 [Armatimonadetes bacterium]|nr:hypothetical protein [Anaerolineae bacterium]